MGFFVGVDLGCELEGGADVVEALEQTSLRDGAISNLNEDVLVPLLLAYFLGRRLTWWRTPSTLRANARKAIRKTAGSRWKKPRSRIASCLYLRPRLG